MRRAVILATLTCILFAVAGVTVAGENTFNPGWQGEDQTESTVPESTVAGRTAPEATVLEATLPEATVPETTVPEDFEKPVEGTEEATIVVQDEPKEPGKGDPAVVARAGIQGDNRIEKAGEPTGKPGKPDHAQGGKNYGKPRVTGKPPDHAGKKGFVGTRGKVTLCHKDRVTISVGAPAESAHLRHGDDIGAC